MTKFIEIMGPYDVVATINNNGYHKNCSTLEDAEQEFQKVISQDKTEKAQLFQKTKQHGILLIQEWPMPVKIPLYIKDILFRSSYVYDPPYTNNPNYSVGYTIQIKKATTQTQVKTMENEIERFQSWVQRQYKRIYKDTSKIFYILDIPAKTHYKNQYAVVTIFDPMMKHLEKYIPSTQKT